MATDTQSNLNDSLDSALNSVHGSKMDEQAVTEMCHPSCRCH